MAHIPKQSKAAQDEVADSGPAPVRDDVKLTPENEAFVADYQAKVESPLRIEFAKIALREIIRSELEHGRAAGREDLAADWAFRYADRMVERSKKAPSRPSYNARGVPGSAIEAPAEPDPVAPTADLAPLAEIP